MKPAEVKIQNIEKSYGGVKALYNISLDIQPGELFGFIGPDGAGKTTLFRIMASLQLPDAGKITVSGLDVVANYKELRHILGYMPGRFSLYPDLSVEENLRFFAGVHGTTIKRNYDLIKDIYQQIEPFKNRPAGKLSGGMKQKLALSCALIHKPALLLLDEPTTGVDAVSRQEFWNMLKQLKKEGITIVVSTPYMDEASLCDKVALMQKGQIMDIEKPSAIVHNFGHQLLSIQSNRMFALLHDLQRIKHSLSAYRFGDSIHYIPHSPLRDFNTLNHELAERGHSEIVIKETQAVVEDCFILLMQQKEKNAWNQ